MPVLPLPSSSSAAAAAARPLMHANDGDNRDTSTMMAINPDDQEKEGTGRDGGGGGMAEWETVPLLCLRPPTLLLLPPSVPPSAAAAFGDSSSLSLPHAHTGRLLPRWLTSPSLYSFFSFLPQLHNFYLSDSPANGSSLHKKLLFLGEWVNLSSARERESGQWGEMVEGEEKSHAAMYNVTYHYCSKRKRRRERDGRNKWLQWESRREGEGERDVGGRKEGSEKEKEAFFLLLLRHSASVSPPPLFFSSFFSLQLLFRLPETDRATDKSASPPLPRPESAAVA